MTNSSTSTADPAPARDATPQKIAHLTAELPTPPASQEKPQLAQQQASRTRPETSPEPNLRPETSGTPEPERGPRAKGYVLTFGMHKGKTLDEVAKADSAYISWLKTSGWAAARNDLGNAMALYDHHAVLALHQRHSKASTYKFTFGKYLNKRIADVPAEFMESLIKDKHHMWSRRPGLREALVFWDEWACLGKQNWHRRRMISLEEKDAALRGDTCRRAKKREVRQMVVW